MPDAFLESRFGATELAIGLKLDWVFDNVSALRRALDSVDAGDVGQITFHCGGLEKIDIAGAWVLFRKSEEFRAAGRRTQFQGFKAAHFKFLENVTKASESETLDSPEAGLPRATKSRRLLESIGRSAANGFQDIGFIARAIFDGAGSPSGLTLKETVRQLEHAGARAVPIVFLVSFLMGVVMAYQGALQLQKFGATIFVVDLVTISVLREMGVLLAAIMVAGRSGSAFAASLGVMNLNQETDALRVMGLNPNRVLVLPRVLALLLALPLLTVLSDAAGLAGGMLLSTMLFEIGAVQFMERAVSSADTQTFLVGFAKAPVFALLIAGVATLRGLQVKSSAENLGRLTTVAVVQSIFLVILADGVFTLIFARYGI